MKEKPEILQWKADVPALFAEIVSANNEMWIMKQPLIIVDNILRQGAIHALKLGDEKMSSIFARLGMYEGCNKRNHPDYERLHELANKKFD